MVSVVINNNFIWLGVLPGPEHFVCFNYFWQSIMPATGTHERKVTNRVDNLLTGTLSLSLWINLRQRRTRWRSHHKDGTMQVIKQIVSACGQRGPLEGLCTFLEACYHVSRLLLCLAQLNLVYCQVIIVFRVVTRRWFAAWPHLWESPLSLHKFYLNKLIFFHRHQFMLN